jgi:hypothetical protein
MKRQIQINPDILQQAVDGETVILMPESGEVCTLDEFSSVVWQIMKDIPDCAEIKGLLAEAFAVPEQQLAEDLEQFWQQLAEKGFIGFSGGEC